ncbi:protein of unknown function [Xenorhabdus poinarii G6]|uniref:Uncharacterized protein n=1 Tax=Xenorhabdus poinarii G6 TaxID=1354304 RepID=A0A068R031_9GAMM|nr:hypothetical protein [Xenorhabdus poinarii]CDG20558.1 protein of unknown function [Xenorhabdus poinarii G6]
MQNKEPVIIANGNTVEEVYQWMEKKLDARRVVYTLNNELNTLDTARDKIKKQLNDAINQAELTIVSPNLDPTLHQEDHQSRNGIVEI